MSIQAVDGALRYFVKLWPLLGGTSSNNIDECLMIASNEGRLRLVDAMLDTIVCRKLHIPEVVALGGLRAIVDPAATMLSYSLFAEDVSASLRFSVLARMGLVFAEIFPERCDPVLVHRATASPTPWNLLCFMWWEMLPRHGVPEVAFLAATDLAILDLMGASLTVDHVACKEAALHGLALWQAGRPDEVRSVIDRHYAIIPDSLWDYALAAKAGNLQ